jgi:hypothetical protein
VVRPVSCSAEEGVVLPCFCGRWAVGSSKVDGVLMLERGGCRAPFLSPSRPSRPLGSGALREVPPPMGMAPLPVPYVVDAHERERY